MIVLEFPGIRPQSKRNSQFRNGYAYVERHYKEWRSMFAMIARGQWCSYYDSGLWSRDPIAVPIAMSVTFKTASGTMRGDLDNSFAACADGLMDAGVLADDKWIKRLSAEVVKVPKGQTGITVQIEALAVEAQALSGSDAQSQRTRSTARTQRGA